jgi:hypothetical protein
MARKRAVTADRLDAWWEGAAVELGVVENDNAPECTFPQAFAPNPGGQSTFWDLVGIAPRPIQYRWLYARGGVGSGKSFGVGAGFACSRAKADPNSRGLITANSYGQLETSTLVALAEFCRNFGIPLDPVASMPMDAPEWPDETARKIAARRLCTIFGAPVLVLSADAFTGTTDSAKERGRGLQIRWAWADEYAYAHASAFNTLNTRLGRGSSGSLKGLGVITSSVNKNNPYNWAYDIFDDPNRSDSRKERFLSIPLTTFENKHLDDDYIEAQSAALTDELYKVEILGEYAVDSVGRIYKTFSRDRHVLYGQDASIVTYQKDLPLHLSFDFNHSPATALAMQVSPHEARVIKEWFILDSDTFEVSDAVAKWASEMGATSADIYGDATGNQKTANSKKTNWAIVWESLRRHGIKGRKRYRDSNPNVIDSINSLNIAFKQDWIYINGDDCPELVKDLETLKRAKDGGIDKTDPMRSHVQDELRYFVDTNRPYRGVAKDRTARSAARGIPL